MGDLQHCTLTKRTDVPAEIDEGQGGKTTKDVSCAQDRDVWLRTFERRLLERCVLAETATIGMIACAGDKEIALSGHGLDTCILASAQRVGPLDLSAGTLVHFSQGRVEKLELPPTSEPLSVSGIDLPPGTVVGLCDQSWDVEWLSVPEDSYVTMSAPISREPPQNCRELAAIDPIWRTNPPLHPDVNGILLRLRHPGFGWLTFILPHHEAAALGKWLCDYENTRVADLPGQE
jgi:hypothetical protein